MGMQTVTDDELFYTRKIVDEIGRLRKEGKTLHSIYVGQGLFASLKKEVVAPVYFDLADEKGLCICDVYIYPLDLFCVTSAYFIFSDASGGIYPPSSHERRWHKIVL